MLLYLSPVLINIIYFCWGKRYKRIIRKHKEFKNKRCCVVTNLFITLCMAFFFAIVTIKCLIPGIYHLLIINFGG